MGWRKGKDNGKGKGAAGSEEDEEAGREALELEVLKAADLFQAEGLLKHCLEGFRGALTVHTVVEQLLWAHKRGPAEARAVATEFFAAHGRDVRKEARETLKHLQSLPGDAYAELVDALLE